MSILGVASLSILPYEPQSHTVLDSLFYLLAMTLIQPARLQVPLDDPQCLRSSDQATRQIESEAFVADSGRVSEIQFTLKLDTSLYHTDSGLSLTLERHASG